MLLLSIPLFMVMGCGNESSHEAIEQIKGRLDTLEEKLTQLETQSAALKKSVSNLDSFVQALDEKSSSLNQQLYEITSKTGSSSSQTQSQFSEGLEGQYHTVVRGETLYSISKKYGLSVGDLQQLNGIKKDQVIKAGQKLLVAPGVY
jgi:LysM repeat protein